MCSIRFGSIVFVALMALQLSADRVLAKANEESKDNEQQPKRLHKRGLVDELSGQAYGMAGCGLGSIIFGDHEGIVQIFAVTTNDFYSNNTFAASSGTSNCENDEDKSAQNFVNTNHVALENDIARGHGETLSAFYGVAGCGNIDEVGGTLKANSQALLSGKTPAQGAKSALYESIRQVLRAHPQTANACTHLG